MVWNRFHLLFSQWALSASALEKGWLVIMVWAQVTFKKNLPMLLALSAVLLIFLAGCKDKQEFPEVVRPVKTMTIKETAAGKIISLPGKTKAFQRVDMAFQVSGRVKEDPFKKGQEVKKGDLLIQLDQTDFKIALAAAKAKRTETKSYLARLKIALDKEVATPTEYETAKAEFDVADANFRAAQQSLEYTSLTAPFDGKIANKMFDQHQEIKAKDPVISLQTSSDIDIDIDLPAIYAATIRKGDVEKITAVFDDDPNAKEFPITNKEAATEADPVTMTYRVTFTMPPPEGLQILPGMSATVKAYLKADPGDAGMRFLVPVTSVKAEADGKRIVWIISKDNKASRREVTVGAVIGESIIIEVGLKTGETIATAGVHYINDGMEVRPMGDDLWGSGK